MMPRSVRFAEAPATGRSILDHAPDRRPARVAYHELARTVRDDARALSRAAPERIDGKRALFSTAVRKPGTLVVECSRCHGRTRLSYLEFAKRRHLPYWAWTPWRKLLALRDVPGVRAARLGRRRAGSSEPRRSTERRYGQRRFDARDP